MRKTNILQITVTDPSMLSTCLKINNKEAPLFLFRKNVYYNISEIATYCSNFFLFVMKKHNRI